MSVLPLSHDASGGFRPPKRRATLALRLGLFAGCSLVALTAYDALGSVLSLLGGERRLPACRGDRWAGRRAGCVGNGWRHVR